MPLQLHTLSPDSAADRALLPRLSALHLRAWLTNHAYAAIYHGPADTHPEIVASNLARHTTALDTDPTVRYTVVLDTDLNGPPAEQVIAFSKSNVFASVQAEADRKDTSERSWPPSTNVVLVNDFWARLVAVRQQHGPAVGPHVLVDLLAADPDHMRRGAGRMLMLNVTQQADQLHLPCMLEGSPEGLKLYKSVGFEEIGEFNVDLDRFAGGVDKGENWRGPAAKEGEGQGWYKQSVMLRPAKH